MRAYNVVLWFYRRRLLKPEIFIDMISTCWAPLLTHDLRMPRSSAKLLSESKEAEISVATYGPVCAHKSLTPYYVFQSPWMTDNTNCIPHIIKYDRQTQGVLLLVPPGSQSLLRTVAHERFLSVSAPVWCARTHARTSVTFSLLQFVRRANVAAMKYSSMFCRANPVRGESPLVTVLSVCRR